MKRLPTIIRLVLGLVSLTASCLLFSQTIGLFPDSRGLITQGRAKLCESLAIQSSLLASQGDLDVMETSLRAIASRNSEIESLAVRRASGDLLLEIGNHSKFWTPAAVGNSNDSQMFVPIATKNEPWGTVEVCFRPIRSAGWRGFFEEPLMRVVMFVALAGAFGYYALLNRVLLQLNPSDVVPSRVRSALDTLTQGLVILDRRQRIVLANQAFCQTVGLASEKLIGREIGSLPWQSQAGEPLKSNSGTPWDESLSATKSVTGVVMDLQVATDVLRIFVVNASPVLSEKGDCQGALISLEDITSMEKTKRDLHEAMHQLNLSTEAISRQNVELERLATTDPLTECMNRRSFFSKFETAWKSSEAEATPLACIMVDIDHFKSVNDTRGHSTGDEVLKAVAAILRVTARDGDLVSRFGGEEFCILLPKTSLKEATAAAERFRRKIASAPIEGLSITASLGVSERTLGARQPSQLLEQADQSLYVAKEQGRNQVVHWKDAPAETGSFHPSTRKDQHQPKQFSINQATALSEESVAELVDDLARSSPQQMVHDLMLADDSEARAERTLDLESELLQSVEALVQETGSISLLVPAPKELMEQTMPLFQ